MSEPSVTLVMIPLIRVNQKANSGQRMGNSAHPPWPGMVGIGELDGASFSTGLGAGESAVIGEIVKADLRGKATTGAR